MVRWLAPMVLVLAACSGPRPGPPKNLPPPITKTTLGPGDKLEIEVVGEKDLPKEFTIESDGALAFPFIKPLPIAGLEPPQAKDKLRVALMEQKVWSSPQINLRVKEYAGKTVIISGQVARPQSVAWHVNLGLVEALSNCGWFTPMADPNHVFLTRHTQEGRTVTVVISVEAITEGVQPDIQLQAGDRIKVQASVL